VTAPQARKGSRSKARKRALDILFESEARGEDPQAVLARRIAGADAPPVSDFAASLVEGVIEHRDGIDEVIGSYARGWTMARMPAVDRMILRIGVYEILHSDEVPDPVAIDEAIDLARELSTDDSPRFVNGVLAGVSSGRPGTVAPPSPDRVEVPAGVELAPAGQDAPPADDEPTSG
jgi:transcription antitermination protein NusB